MGGGAVTLAARDLSAKMAAVAGPLLGCAPDEVAFHDVRLVRTGGTGSLPSMTSSKRCSG